MLSQKIFIPDVSFACLVGFFVCIHVSFADFDTLSWKTGYAYSWHCSTYVHSYGHCEAPQRVSWIDRRLEEKGLKQHLQLINPLDDPMPHILRVHDTAHVAGIHQIPLQDSATEKIGPIADLAAALVLGAVKEVCEGKVKNAFCNIRPPGHHVTNGGYVTGFCAYANVVIAARYAQEVHNHQRILICDWDYHHGNGTLFFSCNDTNIMFFEVSAEGYGSECNSKKVHIITKSLSQPYNNDAYVGVWENYLIAAADAFGPELVLISCGFDIKQNDALGSYRVTAHGISRLTKIAMDIAEKHCNGKLVSILEGGYYDVGGQGYQEVNQRTWYGLSQCAENHVLTLMTGQIQPETPYFDSLATAAVGLRGLRSKNQKRFSRNIAAFSDRVRIEPLIKRYAFDIRGRLIGGRRSNRPFCFQGMHIIITHH